MTGNDEQGAQETAPGQEEHEGGGVAVIPPAVHRTIVAVDVEGFGDPRRRNPDLSSVHQNIYDVLKRAFTRSGIPWERCDYADRGDGALILGGPDADMPKASFVERLPLALAQELSQHNSGHPEPERFRLRMALNAGEVIIRRNDAVGTTGIADGAAVILACRLLDAQPLREELGRSPGVLALIASSYFYDQVIRHSPGIDVFAYRHVKVTVKETTADAWITLPDQPRRPVRHRPPRGQGRGGFPLTRRQVLWIGAVAAASAAGAGGWELNRGPGPGTRLWAYRAGGAVRSGTTVADNQVYVGSDDGSLHALRASNGEQSWFYHTGDSVKSCPAVAHGYVFVGSDDGSVSALRASDGKRMWYFQTQGQVRANIAVWDAGALPGTVVYAADLAGGVYALSAPTGALLWSFTTHCPVYSDPAVAGGVLYVGGYNDSMYAIRGGKRIWAVSEDNSSWESGPAVTGGVVYIGSDDWYAYALCAGNGKRMWRTRTGGSVTSDAVVLDHVVYIGSDDGYVYALRASDGSVKQRYPTTGAVAATPAVVNGVVYVGSEDGTVYAFDAQSGRIIWTYWTGGQVKCDLTVVNGVLYVGSDDGYIYALRT